MDFIERLFSFSPDNGSGATELTIVLALLAVAGLGYALRARRKHRPTV